MQRSILVATMAAMCLGSLPPQDIVLANLAGIPRKQWVDVAVPAVDAAPLPLLCRFDPHGWIAYKGRAIGQHSVMFHVLGHFAANQTVSGRLIGVSNSASALPGWGMSDWVADNTLAVLPNPVLLDLGGVEHRLVNPQLEVVESASPARRVFRLWGRLGTTPMTFDAYLYVYVGQDVVDVECTLQCSDPTMAAMSYRFQMLWIESGEHMQTDYRVRLGLYAPFQQSLVTTHPSYGRWIQILSGTRELGRGEGLHVSGSLLCLWEPSTSPQPISYATHGMSMQWSVADRVDQLLAELEQPCVGVWQHWEDKWLAFGTVPEVPIPFRGDGGVADSDASWSHFVSALQFPSDLCAQRPRGLTRYAPSTGAQEDFGASKGAYAVTVGDPRWIHDAGYSVPEVMMRGFHYREADGSPLKAAAHPLLRCFNQLVHCHTTLDQVGYPCPIPTQWVSNGWSTWDEQHRSHNNLNALFALTGRFALRDQLRDLAEVDKAAVPNWMNSPRAEGRLAMAWANMLLLMEDPADRQALLQTVLNRIQTVQNRWLGGPFVGNPNKPIHAIEIGSDPSFLEPGSSTQRVPAFLTWEHSIAVMGFYACWRVTGDQRFHDMAKDISRVIVDHCAFLENGHWVLPTAIRYLQGAQEGDALPASAYFTGSPHVHATQAYKPWILPSVLICRELHTGNDPARVARCNAILADIAPNGPADWRDAEWWAVLPR